ncbi:MAG TPA: hypothetical protein P5514_06930 [Bacteroidales bacterium]|nr:hypothetical protein [Bacteroidales bacterium]HPE58121.1 hypothetical protein [Bacteroidales bacterium]HRX96661.1 hypothetical protein [Bacteroidales bacterium]
MNSGSESLSVQQLIERINLLEQRITRLENRGVITNQAEEPDNELNFGFSFGNKGESGLESHFGQFGLAWLGNIVLFFGITFFVSYLQAIGYKLVSPLFGLIAVAGIFLLARYLTKSNGFMSRILNLNGYILIFYIVLKLHYFSIEPLIGSEMISLLLVLIFPLIAGFIALRNKNTTLAGLALLMFAAVGVLSDKTHVILPVSLIIAITSTVMVFRLGWKRLVYLAIILAYLVQLIWLFNDPFMGHEVMIIKQHFSGYIYIFLTAAVFALVALLPEQADDNNQAFVMSSIILNGLGFTFVIALFILTFFKEAYAGITGSIALYCLTYAFILQVKTNRKIIAALFALFGFVTLSVCIYGLYGFPRAYFLLAIQSLLVVSFAIWFRSKFIVIMNSFLFLVLLMVYLSTSPIMNSMNISFSIAALATARILNWKKERLTIKTEYIRNFYLLVAFFMVLFMLYHLVADQYITISWAAAAMVYFVLSLVLKNVKYRYLALATMFAAAFYLFIIDLARIEMVFRVLALLVLAVVSIGLSFYYTKKQKLKSENLDIDL